MNNFANMVDVILRIQLNKKKKLKSILENKFKREMQMFWVIDFIALLDKDT
jgi:hypothetical protein